MAVRRPKLNTENINPNQLKPAIKPPAPCIRRPAMTDIPVNREPKKLPLVQKKPQLKQQPPPKSIQSYSSTKFEADEATKHDELTVTEYVVEIHAYLRNLELLYPIAADFLADASSTPKMRATLIDWLVQVHSNFGLVAETLYLSVSIIDRYLQVNKRINSKNLQLVGIGALWLASKYEEIYLPDMNDFVYICDDAFVKADLIKMEMDLIKTLEFSFSKPLALHFLRRYSKVAQVKVNRYNMGKYVLELAMLEYELAHVRPSEQAAAALCLAMCALNGGAEKRPERVWSKEMERCAGMAYADFGPVVAKMATMVERAKESKYQAICDKYAAAKYGKISCLSVKFSAYLNSISRV